VVPEDQTIQSVLPDAQGLLWFTTSGGLVGTVQPDTGQHQVIALGETISKSFAVDPVAERGGIFIVSDYALYRFDADANGRPQITWHEV
jgi:streptogramin lyase